MASRRTLSPEEGGALERVLQNAFTREEAAEALIALGEQEGTHASLPTLRRTIAKLPTLTLYVPTPLAKESVRKIGTWCREALGTNLLLEVRIDQDAAGGCRFVWGGVLHDYSLTQYLAKAGAVYARQVDVILDGAPSRIKAP